MQSLLIIILINLTFDSARSQNFNPFFGNIQPQPQYNPYNNYYGQQTGFQQPNQQYNQPYNPQYIQPYNPQYNQNRPVNNQNRPINNQNRPINNQNRPVNNRPAGTPNRVDQLNFVYPTDPPQTSNVANQRISERKCKEYMAKSSNSVLVGSLSLAPNIQNIKTEQCDASQGLIVGGENAKAGEFPHMAAIGYKNLDDVVDFKCGGTLISERYVLTAAHCRVGEGVRPSVVRVGDLNLKLKDQGLPELDIPIESFISHELYNSSVSKNDIALIRLARDVSFSKFVRPACLMTPNNNIQFKKAIASGWGYTDPLSGGTSDIMQKVELSIIDTNQCNRIFDDPTYYNLDYTQLCAGELRGGKDTCRGDSGGPLQIVGEKNKCVYYVIGITSYGSALCGGENSPGVYTRVSAYIDWIEQKVWRS